MKAVKTLLIIVLCAALVYFVGDKAGFWPEEVTSVVDEAFAKFGSAADQRSADKKDAQEETAVPRQEAAQESTPELNDQAEPEMLPVYNSDEMVERHQDFPEEEVLAGWKGILDEAWRLSAEGDVNGMAELFGCSYEDADGWVQMFKDSSYDNYDSENSYIIASADGYYCVETVYYLVTGTDPNTHQSSFNVNFPITWKDGKWVKADLVPTSYTDNLFSLYDPGLKETFFSGRNGTTFGNFMFSNPDKVYHGCFTNEVYAAWQNEDGSVDISFVGVNGTSGIKSYKSVTITLTDDNLGTICNVTRSGFVDTIAPGRSKTFTVHVEPYEVMTGTNTWGVIHSSVDSLY